VEPTAGFTLPYHWLQANFSCRAFFRTGMGNPKRIPMSVEDDALLMREINNQADKAVQAKPHDVNISTIAAVLAAHFTHRSEEDIKEQLKAVWRAREMFWEE
jgi:hypothetical protein